VNAYYTPLRLTRAHKLALLTSDEPTRVIAAKLGVDLTHAAELRRRAGWPHPARCRRAVGMMQQRSVAESPARAQVECPECGTKIASSRMSTHAGSAACSKAQKEGQGAIRQSRPDFSKAAIAERRRRVIALFEGDATTAQIVAAVGISQTAVNKILRGHR